MKEIFISANSIPDDLMRGISINDMTDIFYHAIQNRCIFCDNIMDSMVFQQKLLCTGVNIQGWMIKYISLNTP